MNRKNLIELTAALAATAALCGCASAPAPQHTADLGQGATAELGSTHNAWAQCVQAAIPKLDDRQTASDAVARAAMKRCSAQYTDMVRVLARTLAPTCSKDPECARDALAKAQREAAKAATDDVVNERVRAAAAQVPKCQ